MQQLFKTNNPLNIILLLLLACFLRSGIFFTSVEFVPSGIGFLTNWIVPFSDARPLLASFVALLLVVGQGVWLNVIANNHRLYNQLNYQPAANYVLLASAFPPMLVLSPALVANVALLGAYHFLVISGKKTVAAGELFNVGFFVGIAALCYYPAGSWLLVAILAIAQLRSFQLKDVLIITIGFLVPFFWAGVYSFWNNSLAEFAQEYLFAPFQLGFSLHLQASLYRWIMVGFYILVAIWSALNINGMTSKKSIQVRRIISATFVALAVPFITILYTPTDSTVFTLFHIPLAIFLAFNWNLIRNVAVAEFLNLLLLLFILFFQYQIVFVQALSQ